MDELNHRPVLVDELLEALDLGQSNTVIDATYGFGGHARKVLESLGPDGELIGFERDPDVYELIQSRGLDPRVTLIRGSYRTMKERLPDRVGRVDAVYFDLGLSSYHLDESERGFSFRRDGDVLDCRFNPGSNSPPAYEVLNDSRPEELKRILGEYGEVRRLDRIVEGIVENRPLKYVGDLRGLVEQNVRADKVNGELARVFQALRIVVNDELDQLDDGLRMAYEMLKVGGRLAAISYHSLEDRRVKKYLQYLEKDCVCPPDLPKCACGKVRQCEIDSRSPVTPKEEEVEANPRARSATLRVAKKVN